MFQIKERPIKLNVLSAPISHFLANGLARTQNPAIMSMMLVQFPKRLVQ
tara:strand:+ start:290 stop:436 length:147 start_codon:yes stop_codon:yes gene_type:complete